MSLNFALIQPYLAILLPLLLPFLADGLASILKQDGFADAVNGAIAWSFLILAAIASAWIDNQLLGTPNLAINAVVGAATLLLSGPLVSLKPWISVRELLTGNLFNVVKALPPVSVLQPNGWSRTSNAVSSPIPPRASAQQQPPTGGNAG